MSRRCANLTLDNLEDLPRPCRQCVFWELDPVAARGAPRSPATRAREGGLGLADAARVGLLRQDRLRRRLPAGYVMYAPPVYVPRCLAFPTSPVSADAVLLMTARCCRSSPAAGWAGCSCRRRPGPHQARRPGDRGVRPRSSATTAAESSAGCVLPADFLLSVGLQDRPPAPALPAAAARTAHRAVLAVRRRVRAREAARLDEPGAGVPAGLTGASRDAAASQRDRASDCRSSASWSSGRYIRCTAATIASASRRGRRGRPAGPRRPGWSGSRARPARPASGSAAAAPRSSAWVRQSSRSVRARSRAAPGRRAARPPSRVPELRSLP